MKLTKTSVYALTSVILIARRHGGAPVSAKSLAEEGRMPERFLLQVLRSLVLRDILVSTRGIDGGYQLRKDPSELNALEVIEAIDGPIGFNVSDASHAFDSSKITDGLARQLDTVNLALRNQLESVSIARVLESPPAENESQTVSAVEHIKVA